MVEWGKLQNQGEKCQKRTRKQQEEEISDIKQQLISADEGYADILAQQTDEYEKQADAMRVISELKDRESVKQALDDMGGWGAQGKMQDQSDRFSSMIEEIKTIDAEIENSENRKQELLDSLATETSEAKKEAIQTELDMIDQALENWDSRKRDLISESLDASFRCLCKRLFT